MTKPLISYIKILAKFWKAKFKYLEYVERKYIDNERVYKNHSDPDKIFTNDKLKLTYDNKRNLNRLIQSVWYERVFIEVIFEENFDYAYLQACNEITIYDENNLPYECEFVEASQEILAGTISKVILSFRILEDNENAISNYLTLDIINEKNLDYNKIVFSNYKNIDNLINFANGQEIEFKTYFEPIIYRSEKEIIENYHKTGIKTIYNSFDFEIVKLRFILTDSELSDLEKYGKRCFYYNSSNNEQGTVLTTQSKSYTSEKNIEYEIIENELLIDCNIIDVILKHDFINYSNYYLTTSEIVDSGISYNRFMYVNYKKAIDDRGIGSLTQLCSVFEPIYSREIVSSKTLKVNKNIEITSNSTNCQTIKLKFILTDTQLIDFEKYAKNSFDYNNGTARGNYFVINSITLTSENEIEYEIIENENFINRNVIEITFKYDYLNYYPLT